MSLASKWLLGDTLEIGSATEQLGKGSRCQARDTVPYSGSGSRVGDQRARMIECEALLERIKFGAGQLRQPLTGGLADVSWPGT